MKRILFILSVFLMAGCLETESLLQPEPLEDWPSPLHTVTLRAVYPEGYTTRAGVEAMAQEIASGASYTATTDA